MSDRMWSRILLATLILAVISLACSISFDENDDTQEDQLRMQLTLQAMQMTLAAEPQKVAQAEPAPQQPAQQPQQPADSSSESSSTASQEGGTPCHASKFVSETIPDGTSYAAGESFSKTWTIRNIGSCKWTEDYRFEFEEGTQMGGEGSIKVNTVVEPNETISFKVNLKAPSTNGDYTGVWRMKAADGEKMGKYWVVIKVGGGAPAPAPAGQFAVTSLFFSTALTPIDLICPDDVTVTASIKTNAAGTVTYRWVDCENNNEDGSLVFNAAGTKNVSHNVPVDFSEIHWAKLYIDSPNHQWFGPVSFEVVCNP